MGERRIIGTMKHDSDNQAAKSTRSFFDNDMERRDFLRTGVSTLLPIPNIAATKKSIGAVLVSPSLTEAVPATRIIPMLRSKLAQEKMKESFGDLGLSALGSGYEACKAALVRHHATEMLPYELHSNMTGRGDWDQGYEFLFGEDVSEEQKKSAIEKAIKIEYEHGSGMATADDWITKLIDDKEIHLGVDSLIGESIAFEMYESAVPTLNPLAEKTFRSLELQYMDHREVLDFIDRDECSYRAFLKTLYEDIGDFYVGTEEFFSSIFQHFTTENLIRGGIERIKTTSIQSSFAEFLRKEIAESVSLYSRLTKGISELNAMDTPWDNASTTETQSESSVVTSQNIIETLQQPLQRLMSQIQLLADPAYERQWETPTASLPQTPQAPRAD